MIRRILGNRRNQTEGGVNTYIGNVPDITSAQILATQLGISVNNISSFSAINNNIEATINTAYAIPGSFRSAKSLSYYRDIENKVTSIGGFAFYTNTVTKTVKAFDFPNATSAGNGAFNGEGGGATFLSIRLDNVLSVGNTCFSSNSNVKSRIYLPKVTALGSTVNTHEFVFRNLYRTILYLNPYLQTNNGGGEDADVVYFRTNVMNANLGAAVVYVLNETKPSAITNLSHSAGTLNFTPPASANALSFYEVYVNGLYLQEITGSGASVSGLVAGDKVVVYACDIYYNRSKSNEITI